MDKELLKAEAERNEMVAELRSLICKLENVGEEVQGLIEELDFENDDKWMELFDLVEDIPNKVTDAQEANGWI